MIADLIIIGLIIVFTLIGMKRGIAATILNIAGIILTSVLAYYLSGFLSDFIYDTFLQQTVNDNLGQLAEQSGVQYAAENCFQVLPNWINGFISFIAGLFGINVQNFHSEISSSQINDINALSAVEKAVGSVVTSAFDIILFILLAIIIFIFVKMLIRRLNSLFKLPVINQLNKLFGGILGLIEGIVFVFIAVNILYVLLNPSNPQVIDNSFVSGKIFEFFCIMD